MSSDYVVRYERKIGSDWVRAKRYVAARSNEEARHKVADELQREYRAAEIQDWRLRDARLASLEGSLQ